MASSATPIPAASSATTKPFDFPREYNFPPFFTRQANLATLHSQRDTWSQFILAYCRHHRIFRLSLSSAISTSSSSDTAGGNNNNNNDSTSSAAAGASNSTGTAAAGGHDVRELFHNRRLDRRLPLADARDVLEHMRKDGRAEPTTSSTGTSLSLSSSSGETSDVWWIYWRTPDEWAAMIEGYVDETAQRGTVLTLYELVEGEGTRGREFHGLHPDLLQKALQTLVKRGKAQIFGHEDSQGVKFF
ncbi:ESCRT-II complex subunit-domain-containing protein [Microdochium bolleyi]|uniref:ESCRT-II complex subunit VPS25 n=1 Tax=Microdochium bolleyi TaxID=196109 RepID=A0A136JI27_9PEZI|nr:ESCRT-II complex subunit-domain-containing protein [Microdochium bolleyi]